jgi:hypothetical protein
MDVEFNPQAPGVTKGDMSDYLYRVNPGIKFPKSIHKQDLIKLVDAQLEAGLLQFLRFT